MSSSTTPTRRQVLQGAGLVGTVGAVAVVTSGCGFIAAGSNNGPVDEATGPPPSSAINLGPAAAVPVGGGTIYSAEQIVVTQPTPGVYHGFSAVCTHLKCLVTSVSDGQIHCPCHNSAFSVTDGSVTAGPAPTPLPPAQVTVVGTDLVLGS